MHCLDKSKQLDEVTKLSWYERQNTQPGMTTNLIGATCKIGFWLIL